ncbi:MAG: hypothetical protein AAGB93_04350 [Planctomycetota bacterium]
MAEPRDEEPVPLESATERTQPVANSLWASLAGLVRRKGHRRILFTSVERHAGTSVVAAQSVVGLVKNTRTTAAMLEVDLASPNLAAYLGIDPAPGLTELLDGKASLEEVKRSVAGCTGLSVLVGGTPRVPIPGEFATDAVGRHVEALANENECLFIDAPPILTHPETRLMLEYVDGVILVLRARATLKRQVREVERLLDDMSVPVLGSILNRYRSDMPFGLE